MNDFNTPGFLSHIRNIRERVVDEFMARQNVVACGIGYKRRGDEEIPIPSLTVSVLRKLDSVSLSSEDVIPQSIDDVATDIIETGPITAFGLNRRTLLRPARPGMSVGHHLGKIGTIGAVVRRGDDLFILSNNHVLALINRGKSGDLILQPAPGDGGQEDHVIGVLADYIPLKFMSGTGVSAITSESLDDDPSGCGALIRSLFGLDSTPEPNSPKPTSELVQANLVDAALARVTGDRTLDPRIIDLNGPPRGIREAELGLPVIKSGRTSGLTQGIIRQIDVTVDVSYDNQLARFTDQIIVSPFSKSGDSGSLVLDQTQNAVGLLFSGSDQVSVVTPIQTVLNALDVELVFER